MGFDKLDLRSFKLHSVAGVDLLDMSEDEMVVRLLLPRHKVRAGGPVVGWGGGRVGLWGWRILRLGPNCRTA